MKSNQRNSSPPKDTPATRKKRLQERLKEISARSEQEMSVLMQSLDKMKAAIKPNAKAPIQREPDSDTVAK